MSLAVRPVTFTSNNNNSRSKTEQTAAGVGVAGATTAYASNVAKSRGVFEKFSSAGSRINQLTAEANEALAAARKASNDVSSWGKLFKAKRLKFKSEALNFCAKFKNAKFIGKLMNNPVTNKLGGIFGTTMAFFVLVPSVINMVNVADDIKKQ